VATVAESVASFERNIEVQTGKSVAAWSDLAGARGFARHGDIVAWLKQAHGLSHSHANHIAKLTLGGAARQAAEDPVAHLFAAGKEALRPMYNELVSTALHFGTDVEIAAKKANVSVRRRKQFALIQPSTRTRLDLGLILKDVAPHGRLEEAGSFNAMFTHRVKISNAADIDNELKAWLKAAYEAAA
jgi:hypothetical protein